MVALSTLSQLSKLSSASPASSKSLVSFFGVLVAATELVVVGLFKAGSSSSDASKGGFRGATHTIPVVYKPTQCLPSSDAMVAPSFLFYGPFIVMLVSAVCTLGCVTGTGTSPPAPPTPQDPQNTQHIVQTPSSNSLLYDGQPPPPPPIDPGSETDGKLPRPRSFWWMIFLFILVGVPAFLLRFHFPISGTDMSSVASTYVSSRLAQLAALVKPYIPEIRWVQYIPEIPCAQIATHMAIVSLSSGLFCVVICIGIQLGRKGLYYLQSLSLSPNPPDWLCYIGVSSFLPILMLFLCCGILDLCFNFQLFALFHEGFILATTKECLDPVVAALLRILSPSDISIILGPAVVLVALLFLHGLWRLFAHAATLYSRGHDTQAYMILLAINGMGLNWIFFFYGATVQGLQGVRGLWNLLEAWHQMIILIPPSVYYFRYYAGPILDDLVVLLKTKARSRQRLKI